MRFCFFSLLITARPLDVQCIEVKVFCLATKKKQAAELVHCGEFILHTDISTFVYNIVYEKEEMRNTVHISIFRKLIVTVCCLLLRKKNP